MNNGDKMDYKKVKPLRDDVLLRLKPAREVQASLIYFKEDTSNSPLQSFYVEAVGPDVKHVKVGDVVICSWKRVTVPFDLHMDGKSQKFGITSEKEIDAVVE